MGAGAGVKGEKSVMIEKKGKRAGKLSILCLRCIPYELDSLFYRYYH